LYAFSTDLFYAQGLSVEVEDTSCPNECICYHEQLGNIESWNWIKKDFSVTPDDPDHDDFNPYTEHNEVHSKN